MVDGLRQYKANIFRALAHPTRVALVECLSCGELSVNTLCEQVGVEQANASQHLSTLRAQHIVQTRKNGNQIFYRLRDPAFARVLEALRDYYLAHLADVQAQLRRERVAARKTKVAPRRTTQRDNTKTDV